MKRLFLYTGPDNEPLENPTVADIGGLLRRGKAYWHGESGSAVIARSKREPAEAGLPEGWSKGYPELHLIVHKPGGVHLAYEAREDGPLWVSYDASRSGRRVRHQLGGSEVTFPRESFLAEDVALQAIEEFLRTGKRSDAVQWRKGRFETDTEFEFIGD